jgi:hypothetical protein
MLPRDQAVRHVLARQSGRRCSRLLKELVSVHVTPDHAGTVRQTVREARVRRQQQKVRTPAVSRRDDERLGAIFDRLGGTVLIHRLRGDDPRLLLVGDQPADERAIVQNDLLRRDELLEREVGRVACA